MTTRGAARRRKIRQRAAERRAVMRAHRAACKWLRGRTWYGQRINGQQRQDKIVNYDVKVYSHPPTLDVEARFADKRVKLGTWRAGR